MANRPQKPGSIQIESDKRLCEFGEYEAYLNSLVEARDLEFLQDTTVAEKIAELGYWSSGQILDRKSFEKRSKLARQFFYPVDKPLKLRCKDIEEFVDPFLKELAKREQANMEGYVLTIIFLRMLDDENFEISGYIDYRQRLKKQNFRDIFLGKKKLVPHFTDMIFAHWPKERVFRRDTENFAIFPPENETELCLFCKHDRKKIIINPTKTCGSNNNRFTCPTNLYLQAVFYDHCVMKKINLISK